MAVKDVAYFKALFKEEYKITEQDYADWLDSFRSVLVGVPLSDTTGLDVILADYRLKAESVPVGEVSGLSTYVSGLLANYLTSSSAIAQSQVTGLVDALSGKATLAEVQQAIADAIAGITQSAPYIGENGNWYVNGEDTGVKAEGDPGAPGGTYTIGSNGNWITPSGEDTGVRAGDGSKTDYNDQISGIRDTVNKVFHSSQPFVTGTLKVWVDGGRLSAGNDKDYVELGETGAQINRIIRDTTALIFEYQKKNILP